MSAIGGEADSSMIASKRRKRPNPEKERASQRVHLCVGSAPLTDCSRSMHHPVAALSAQRGQTVESRQQSANLVHDHGRPQSRDRGGQIARAGAKPGSSAPEVKEDRRPYSRCRRRGFCPGRVDRLLDDVSHGHEGNTCAGKPSAGRNISAFLDPDQSTIRRHRCPSAT